MAKFLCNGLPSRTTDWSKWRVFFCDERHVPFTDPECTYTIYKSKLVDNGGPLPGENIFPINPDLSGKFLYLQSRIQVYMLIMMGRSEMAQIFTISYNMESFILNSAVSNYLPKKQQQANFCTSTSQAHGIVCIINLVLKIQHCTCPLLNLQWRMQPRHTRRRSSRCLEEWTFQNSICCCQEWDQMDTPAPCSLGILFCRSAR